ncbi:MAG: hypothetical protein L7S45_01325 [Luminiphilus sp.]|nr:hypothetical protein [Luminiphilus sp.]
MLPSLGKQDDEIAMDGVSLDQIAREFGTPLFVFSGSALRDRVSAFRSAFDGEWPRFQLMPSLKACPILAIRQLLTELDCGCDVFGPGELEGDSDLYYGSWSGLGKRRGYCQSVIPYGGD